MQLESCLQPLAIQLSITVKHVFHDAYLAVTSHDMVAKLPVD
jgi:hypothetical protein